jgi:phosphoglycerate kinase
MALHSLKALTLKEKKVLVRLDLDLPSNAEGFDLTRLEAGAQTLNLILKRGAASVHVIGHYGRPEGKVVKKYSLEPITKLLLEMVPEKSRSKVTFGENLRFDPGEESNNKAFAKKLAKGFDLYVNDAFATAHREHASMTLIPEFIPTVLGRTFEKEMKVLQRLRFKPDRPIVLLLGGAKSEKLSYSPRLFDFVNIIIVAGKLAGELDKAVDEKENRKLIVAELTEDGLDITKDSTEQIERFLKAAGTVIWNGPVGKYEDEIHATATRYLADSIVKSKMNCIVGGGDTEAAIDHLGFDRTKFTHISTGGGAMMEYLAEGTLPALAAAEASQKNFPWEDLLEFVL